MLDMGKLEKNCIDEGRSGMYTAPYVTQYFYRENI